MYATEDLTDEDLYVTGLTWMTDWWLTKLSRPLDSPERTLVWNWIVGGVRKVDPNFDPLSVGRLLPVPGYEVLVEYTEGAKSSAAIEAAERAAAASEVPLTSGEVSHSTSAG